MLNNGARPSMYEGLNSISSAPKMSHLNWAWWRTPVVPALGKQRQDDSLQQVPGQSQKASLGLRGEKNDKGLQFRKWAG